MAAIERSPCTAECIFNTQWESNQTNFRCDFHTRNNWDNSSCSRKQNTTASEETFYKNQRTHVHAPVVKANSVFYYIVITYLFVTDRNHHVTGSNEGAPVKATVLCYYLNYMSVCLTAVCMCVYFIYLKLIAINNSFHFKWLTAVLLCIVKAIVV